MTPSKHFSVVGVAPGRAKVIERGTGIVRARMAALHMSASRPSDWRVVFNGEHVRTVLEGDIETTLFNTRAAAARLTCASLMERFHG